MATQTSAKSSAVSKGETRVRKPAAATAAAPVSSVTVAPSHEAISQLAAHYWNERGRPHGSAELDWLRAEQELRGRAS